MKICKLNRQLFASRGGGEAAQDFMRQRVKLRCRAEVFVDRVTVVVFGDDAIARNVGHGHFQFVEQVYFTDQD
jgi:hypothetical protein